MMTLSRYLIFTAQNRMIFGGKDYAYCPDDK